MKQKNKGFTLIELIVVMAIIGVLVLLAVPKFIGFTERAKTTEIISNIKQLENASERYYMDRGDWPRLNDNAYTTSEIISFAEEIKDKTGQIVTLDADGKYYDINYTQLQKYVQKPKDGIHYIIQNPVGSIFYLDGLKEDTKPGEVTQEPEESPIEEPVIITPHIQLNGNEYIEFPNYQLYNLTNKITLEAWVNINSNAVMQSIICKQQNGQYALKVYQNKWTFMFWVGSSGVYQKVYSDLPAQTNEWVHLAATYDGTVAKLFVNGVEQSNPLYVSGSMTANNVPLAIGHNPPNDGEFINAKIRDVRIWNVSRTSLQIANNFNKELVGNETGLLGYWKLNDGSGNVIRDSSINKNHGTAYGSYAWFK